MAVSYPPPSGVKRDVDQTLPENPSTVKQPSEIEVICELENTVMVKYSSRTEDGSKVDNNFKVNYRPNVEDSSKSEDLSQVDESFMAGNYSDVENHSKVEDPSKVDLPHVESPHTKSDEFLTVGVCYKTEDSSNVEQLPKADHPIKAEEPSMAEVSPQTEDSSNMNCYKVEDFKAENPPNTEAPAGLENPLETEDPRKVEKPSDVTSPHEDEKLSRPGGKTGSIDYHPLEIIRSRAAWTVCLLFFATELTIIFVTNLYKVRKRTIPSLTVTEF